MSGSLREPVPIASHPGTVLGEEVSTLLGPRQYRVLGKTAQRPIAAEAVALVQWDLGIVVRPEDSDLSSIGEDEFLVEGHELCPRDVRTDVVEITTHWTTREPEPRTEPLASVWIERIVPAVDVVRR